LRSATARPASRVARPIASRTAASYGTPAAAQNAASGIPPTFADDHTGTSLSPCSPTT
jgi:hypothetical protein